MHNTLRSTVAVVATAALLLTGCTARDRAGGQAAAEIATLTFAQPNDSTPEQLMSFAAEVDHASHGTMKIAFKDAWRHGEALYEQSTVADVQHGKADMAWVGARVFDKVGVTSFEPLLAPMLVDSHALQEAVFETRIPEQMMAGLTPLGLVGVGVLPGPMRKLLSKRDALAAPGTLSGLKVGIQSSALADEAFNALGATTVELPSGADISGVDAYEQQLSSVWGNHYEEKGGRSVAGNLNLWPRPLVIFAGEKRWSRLSTAQQDILREAAAHAIAPALKASREEDAQAVSSLCHAGLTLPQLTVDQLAAFQSAFAPTVQRIAAVAENAAWLTQIQALKSKTAAPPDTVVCNAASRAAAPTPLSGKTFRTPTDAVSGCADGDEGTVDVEFGDGEARVYFRPPGGARALDSTPAYTVLRDVLTIKGTPGGDLVTKYMLSGDALTLTYVSGGDCGDRAVWTTHPWTEVK